MHGDVTSGTPIPIGYCHCGCGGKTEIVQVTDLAKGRVKGDLNQYINGHNVTHRKEARYVQTPRGYNTDCWVWQLAKSEQGYALERSSTGKLVRAHRRYYEDRFGHIPDGLQLDHLCRVRDCVNPGHLEPVTGAVNTQRGAKAKLTPEIVFTIRASTEKQAVLARRYGVGQPQISRIRNNRTWRNLEPE